jgi:hypothetical protein
MNTKEIALKALDKLTISKDRHSEGEVAKAIESETTKMPSDLFLWTGLGCLGVSAVLRGFGLTSLGQLVGQLSAPILIMGLYNKLVKLHGSEGPTSHGTAKVSGAEKRSF